jgi:hypothetical protein
MKSVRGAALLKGTSGQQLCRLARRREAAARAEAGRLRSRIEELSEDLSRAGEHASRLAIACEEVTRVLDGPAAAELPAGQDGRPAGLATDKAKVEGVRSKLKLLASRGWLAAVPGGLFTLPDHSGKAAKPGR